MKKIFYIFFALMMAVAGSMPAMADGVIAHQTKPLSLDKLRTLASQEGGVDVYIYDATMVTSSGTEYNSTGMVYGFDRQANWSWGGQVPMRATSPRTSTTFTTSDKNYIWNITYSNGNFTIKNVGLSKYMSVDGNSITDTPTLVDESSLGYNTNYTLRAFSSFTHTSTYACSMDGGTTKVAMPSEAIAITGKRTSTWEFNMALGFQKVTSGQEVYLSGSYQKDLAGLDADAFLFYKTGADDVVPVSEAIQERYDKLMNNVVSFYHDLNDLPEFSATSAADWNIDSKYKTTGERSLLNDGTVNDSPFKVSFPNATDPIIIERYNLPVNTKFRLFIRPSISDVSNRINAVEVHSQQTHDGWNYITTFSYNLSAQQDKNKPNKLSGILDGDATGVKFRLDITSTSAGGHGTGTVAIDEMYLFKSTTTFENIIKPIVSGTLGNVCDLDVSTLKADSDLEPYEKALEQAKANLKTYLKKPEDYKILQDSIRDFFHELYLSDDFKAANSEEVVYNGTSGRSDGSLVNAVSIDDGKSSSFYSFFDGTKVPLLFNNILNSATTDKISD